MGAARGSGTGTYWSASRRMWYTYAYPYSFMSWEHTTCQGMKSTWLAAYMKIDRTLPLVPALLGDAEAEYILCTCMKQTI